MPFAADHLALQQRMSDEDRAGNLSMAYVMSDPQDGHSMQSGI